MMLRALVVDDRVAHREDRDWREGDGIVERVAPEGIYVRWEREPEDLHGPYSREELVAMDDEDNTDDGLEYCRACHRDELTCSMNPCDAVREDREATV